MEVFGRGYGVRKCCVRGGNEEGLGAIVVPDLCTRVCDVRFSADSLV